MIKLAMDKAKTAYKLSQKYMKIFPIPEILLINY